MIKNTLMNDFFETVIFQSEDGGEFIEEAVGEDEQIQNSKTDPTIYDPEQVMLGMKVEMEHNDLTQGDPIKIAEIVKAHLDEDAEYYTKLDNAGL